MGGINTAGSPSILVVFSLFAKFFSALIIGVFLKSIFHY